ncbi:MAG: hypothetical protein ACK4G3_02105 [bacterium]
MRVWLKTKRGAMGVFPAKEIPRFSDLLQKFPTADGEIGVPVVRLAQMDAFEIRIRADKRGSQCIIRINLNPPVQWDELNCPIRVFLEHGNRTQFIGLVERMEISPGKMGIEAEGMR